MILLYINFTRNRWTLNNILEGLTCCSNTRFARVVGWKLSPGAFIGQERFEILMKGHGAISVGAGAVKVRFRGRR